jgi:capsular polysaccharide biosynthesis protein
VARRLAGLDDPRVVVLTRAEESSLLDEVRSLAPTAAVIVVSLPVPADGLRRRLVAGGPYDLVVDLAGARGVRRRFAEVAWHVRRGGAVVVRLPEPSEGGTDEQADKAHRFFEGLAAGRALGVPGLKPRHRRALLQGIDGLELSAGWVRATRTTDALPKLGEDEATELLVDRPAIGATLDTVPGATWRVSSEVTASRPLPRNVLPTEYAAPPAALREYRDAVVMPGRASWVDAGVLPESFRFQGRAQLRNRELHELAPRFVARPPEPVQRLPGAWFHLSSPLPHHFGHTLTEQLGHAWGWARARELHPGIRALVATKDNRRLAAWELEVLAAAGIPAELVTEVTEPVRVERLLDTTAMYEIGGFVHPAMRGLYERVGAALAAGATSSDRPARLFHTRRSAKRRCRNQAEVEAMFADAGFAVVAPEDSPLADQVARVRAAEVVAGFAGSAMFHIALAARPQHVVVITHEGYPAHNEYQLAALLGHRLDLAVCVPDVRRTKAGYQRSAFHSDFVVDPETEGAYLRSVLASLPDPA